MQIFSGKCRIPCQTFIFFFDGDMTLTEEQLAHVGLTTMIEFCLSSPNYVYVFDASENQIVAASDSLYSIFELRPDDVKNVNADLYKRMVPEGDLCRMKEFRISAEEILCKNYGGKKQYHCLEFNLHLNIKGKAKLCHFSSVPFMFKKDGTTWMTLGVISPISKREADRAVLRIKGERTYYQYDFDNHKWIEKYIVELNDKEKSVLIFSAQGFTEREIAEMMFKSHNSIKTYKRSLFRKLGVSSIAEALMYSLNNHLL